MKQIGGQMLKIKDGIFVNTDKVLEIILDNGKRNKLSIMFEDSEQGEYSLTEKERFELEVRLESRSKIYFEVDPIGKGK